MCVSCGKTFCLVPRSVSCVKVKVKYQGHILKNDRYGGISVSQTQPTFSVSYIFRSS